jgi:ribosomal protein L37AE/L43A
VFIKEITNQSRRDLQVIFKCEHCGEEKEGRGYDDDFFHKEVVPNKECESCGEKAPDTYVPRTPKYPAGMQV